MKSIRSINLKTAVSHIKQVSDNARDRKERLPFFFIVGAGISHPSVPLAAEIEQHCRSVAQQYGRAAEPRSQRSIDTYSHWFEKAYPQPLQRQQYLRSLIENKPLTHANLRLAHLLLRPTIASLVVTTNFDDFISRGLTLFGEPHILCDHPLTVERIDPERDDLQIVHVHGSYWFYDCCNLTAEIKNRSRRSKTTPFDMTSLLENILMQRSPLIVGYSGWEGDVIMAALKQRLRRPLPYNLYWFCHRRNSIDTLPEWLRTHSNVYFVLPPEPEPERNFESSPIMDETPDIADERMTLSFAAEAKSNLVRRKE